MIKAHWRQRRFDLAEASLLRSSPNGAPFAAALREPTLQRVHQRQQAAERSHFRALTELRRAQRLARAGEEAQPVADPNPETFDAPVLISPPARNSQPARQIHAIGSAPSQSLETLNQSVPLFPHPAANVPQSAAAVRESVL
jgi:hypothetical protein